MGGAMVEELKYVCKDCQATILAKNNKDYTHGIMYSCPNCAERRDMMAKSLIDSVFPQGFEFIPVKPVSSPNLKAKLAKIRGDKNTQSNPDNKSI